MQRHMSRYQASIKPSLSIIRLLLIATAIVAPIAFVIKLHIIKIHGIRYLAGFGALYVIKLSINRMFLWWWQLRLRAPGMGSL